MDWLSELGRRLSFFPIEVLPQLRCWDMNLVI
jgi:hypothetical protein